MSEINFDAMTSREMLNYLVAKNMEDARQAKARGDLVCWASSIAPCEFCEAMGIYTVYPENHVVGIAARKGAPELLAYAEQKGYSNDICAYARISLAYAKIKDAPEQNMPQPDFLLCCNNICNCMIKWYENLSRELNIPMIMIDVPFNPDYEVSDAELEYVKAQFWAAIHQLQKRGR